MFIAKSVTRLFSILFLGLVFTVLAGCGSGGLPGESNTPAGSGSVALLLTDAPSDDFDEINITVTKAELLSDDGRVTLFHGEGVDARTFNLLDLTDARIFAIREGVPAGSYSKIRLTLSDIELVDYNGSNNPEDYLSYHPSRPGNGKLDLNPQGDFNVVADGTLTIQIDIDASKSIHIVKKNNKDEYNFRPVVFIDIVTDNFKERFVKLHGDIFAINTDQQTFKLCNTDIPVRRLDDEQVKDDSRGCVHVETDDTTSIFDINGNPVTFSALALLEGEPATVFGRLLRDTDDHTNSFDDERELDDLVLKAALIELGPETAFLKLNGTATSVVNIDHQFTMNVAPGQGIAASDLMVQIQRGTRLINRKGQPVDKTAIYDGKLVSVRGVLELGVLDVDSDILFASLIVVDTDSSTKLTGTVGANPDNSCGFSLLVTESEMGPISDRSVAIDSNTKAFMVVDGSSSPINVSELGAGQKADVYGISNSTSGCFDAHTIIAY